jgi:hypothetical protein
MFQPNFDERSPHDSSERFNKLAFVVGEPNETRADYANPRATHQDEEAEWMSDRLTELYNE